MLRAIREDETAARSLGKSPDRVRLTGLRHRVGDHRSGRGALRDLLRLRQPAGCPAHPDIPDLGHADRGRGGKQPGVRCAGAFLIWGAWTFSGWALSRFAPVDAQLYTGSIQFVLIGLVIVGMLLWRPQGLFPERLVVSQPGRSNRTKQQAEGVDMRTLLHRFHGLGGRRVGSIGRHRSLAQDCTTKIGAALPTSVDWGRPIAEVAQFAVDQVNEAGGVCGMPDRNGSARHPGRSQASVSMQPSALVDLEGVNVLLGAVSSGVFRCPS